jgi:elongation factor G
MGVIDLITLHGYIWHEETIGKEYSIIPTPEDMVEDAYLQREQLIETLIQKDELLFERYLSKKELTPDEIKAAIRRQTIKCRLFPTLCGSSLKNRGIQPLIDAVVDYLPAPSDLPPIKGWHPENNKEDTRICSPEEPVAALCFKIRSDPYLGNLAYIRLYSGKIRVGEQLYNPRIKRAIRVEKLLLLHANKRSEIKEAQAGEIAAIAGKKDVLTGDTLCSIKEPIILEPIHPPEPVICVAIEPEKHEDVDKFLPTLKLLTTEDPTLKVNFNPETGQVLLFGMGELHLEITLERLRREFNLNLRHFPPQVAYKESIKKEVIREGRYIKQTGGKGHYGHVILKISPLAKIEGKEVIFENKITGGKIPKEYIPGVEKGIKEAAQAGILGGFSVIDIKVSLIDGSFHEVDSSELAFKNAAYQAFKEALSSADPILVEPIMKLEINIPEEFLGNVCDDINSKRGEIKEIQAQDNRRIIKVEAPLRCLFGYATTLRSLTQGRGNYFMDFSHYQELPQKLLPQVLGERVNV